MYTKIYQKILLPFFEKKIKKRHMLDHLAFMNDSQWWPREKVLSFQACELARLLIHAGEQSPYYRRLFEIVGVDRDLLRNVVETQPIAVLDDVQARVMAELRKLPLLDKDIIRAQKDELIAGNYAGKTWTKATGGSTGVPLELDYTPESYDWRVAASRRGYSWAGCLDGMKQAYIWGVAIGKAPIARRIKEMLHYAIIRQKYFNCFDFNKTRMAQAMRAMERYKPEIIVGYTNPLYHFALFLEEQGGARFQPKACITAAEKLHEFQRDQIAKVFNCPVFGTYGSREFMLIAAECSHHNAHISAENLVVEIVRDDGMLAAPGEMGDIVITDLHNYGMPFIRYKIGDMGIMSDDVCACGRGLPALKEVVGRSLDMLRTVDGRYIPGEFFPHLMKEFKEVKQFQVIQKALDTLIIKVVAPEALPQDKLDLMRDEMIRTVGAAMKIDIQFVDDIPLTKTGKFRVTVCEIPD